MSYLVPTPASTETNAIIGRPIDVVCLIFSVFECICMHTSLCLDTMLNNHMEEESYKDISSEINFVSLRYIMLSLVITTSTVDTFTVEVRLTLLKLSSFSRNTSFIMIYHIWSELISIHLSKILCYLEKV